MTTINADAVIASLAQHYPRATLDEAGRRSWSGSLRRLAERHNLSAREVRLATQAWMDTHKWPPNAPIELVNLALLERRRNASPPPDPDLGPPAIRSRKAAAWLGHCLAVMGGDRPIPEGLPRGGAAEERWHRAMVSEDLGDE